jgi:hypothetical protein
MDTEVVDANTPAAPVFDQAQFTQALINGLVPALQGAKTPQAQTDEIDQVVGALKAAGLEDSAIQAHITAVLGLEKKNDRKLAETVKTEAGKLVNFVQQSKLEDALRAELRSYTKDDDLIREASDAILNRARADWYQGNTGEVVTARNSFFQTGSLDLDAVANVVAKQVKRIEQAADKRSGKSKSTNPTIPASDTNARPGAGGSNTLPEEGSLLPFQQIAYDMVMKAGQRGGGITTPDALKELKAQALVAAAKVKK